MGLPAVTLAAEAARAGVEEAGGARVEGGGREALDTEEEAGKAQAMVEVVPEAAVAITELVLVEKESVVPVGAVEAEEDKKELAAAVLKAAAIKVVVKVAEEVSAKAVKEEGVWVALEEVEQPGAADTVGATQVVEYVAGVPAAMETLVVGK